VDHRCWGNSIFQEFDGPLKAGQFGAHDLILPVVRTLGGISD
jgi:hypothetical protein